MGKVCSSNLVPTTSKVVQLMYYESQMSVSRLGFSGPPICKPQLATLNPPDITKRAHESECRIALPPGPARDVESRPADPRVYQHARREDKDKHNTHVLIQFKYN